MWVYFIILAVLCYKGVAFMHISTLASAEGNAAFFRVN